MRIRDLMIVVLYAGIATGVLIGVSRAPRPERYGYYLLMGMLLPALLAGLTEVHLDAGPLRDWITSVFATMGTIVMALFLAAPTFIVAGLRIPRPPQWDLRFLIISPMTATVLGVVAIKVVVRSLIPRRCPGCGRRALIVATGQGELRRDRPLYFRWWACDRVCRLTVVEIAVKSGPVGATEKRLVSPQSWRVPVEDRPYCPCCKRKTLRQVPYTFFWCVACSSRYKCVRRDAWEDAGKPEDDCFYQIRKNRGGRPRRIDQTARNGGHSDSPR